MRLFISLSLVLQLRFCSSARSNYTNGESSLRFLVIGDIGGLPIVDVTSVQKQVARAMIKRSNGIQSIINLGDNFYFTGVMSDSDQRFQTTFENVYRETRAPWLTIAGNHDHMGNVDAQIAYTSKSQLWYFPSLYYNKVFRDGDLTVEFVMMDTIELCGNTVDVQSGQFWDFIKDTLKRTLTGEQMTVQDPAKAEEQWKWIEQTLKDSRTDYLFVAGHYPVYSIASEGPVPCLIDRLSPLLKKYQVTAYFSGHDHNLQHLEHDGVTYIVSGAGSRSDPTTLHKKSIQQRGVAVHWHYPPFSLLRIGANIGFMSQLGIDDGGFVELDISKNKTTVQYVNKEGDTKYVSYLYPKWMPAMPSIPEVTDDL